MESLVINLFTIPINLFAISPSEQPRDHHAPYQRNVLKRVRANLRSAKRFANMSTYPASTAVNRQSAWSEDTGRQSSILFRGNCARTTC